MRVLLYPLVGLAAIGGLVAALTAPMWIAILCGASSHTAGQAEVLVIACVLGLGTLTLIGGLILDS